MASCAPNLHFSSLSPLPDEVLPMKQQLDISPSFKGKIELVSRSRYLLLFLLVLFLPIACSAKPQNTQSSTRHSSTKSRIETDANSSTSKHNTPTATSALSVKNKKVAGPTSTNAPSKELLFFPFFETQTTSKPSDTTTTKNALIGLPIPILSWLHPPKGSSTTTQQRATTGTETQTSPATTTDPGPSRTPHATKSDTHASPGGSTPSSPSQQTTIADTHTTISESSPSPTTTTLDDPMVSVQMLSPSTSVIGDRTITIGTPPLPSNPTSPHGALHDPSSPTVIVLIPPGSQNLTLVPPGQIIVLLKGDKGVMANAAATVLAMGVRPLLLVCVCGSAAAVLM